MALGFDRRRFLGGACAFAAVGCSDEAKTPTPDTGTVGTDDSGTSVPTTTDSPTTSGLDGYPCDQAIVDDGTYEVLSLVDYPDLGTVGGWYPVTVGGSALVIAHVVEGCYAAIDRACTHQGGLLNYAASRGQFVCPLHGAVYAPDGAKVAGPQPAAVGHHPCGRVGDAILVKL